MNDQILQRQTHNKNGTDCAQIRRAFPLRNSSLPTANRKSLEHSSAFCALCLLVLTYQTFSCAPCLFGLFGEFGASQYAPLHPHRRGALWSVLVDSVAGHTVCCATSHPVRPYRNRLSDSSTIRLHSPSIDLRGALPPSVKRTRYSVAAVSAVIWRFCPAIRSFAHASSHLFANRLSLHTNCI